MKSGIKIIKRSRTDEVQNAPLRQDEKTGRQSEREIANTVKSWIAEQAQRRLADEQTAAQILAATHGRAFDQHAAQ